MCLLRLWAQSSSSARLCVQCCFPMLENLGSSIEIWTSLTKNENSNLDTIIEAPFNINNVRVGCWRAKISDIIKKCYYNTEKSEIIERKPGQE